MVQGKGHHQYITYLLDNYDPRFKFLTRYGAMSYDRNISNDVFIYEEKNVFRVPRDNAIYRLEEPEYERRELEMDRLREWIAAYKQANGGIDIFYEDANLRIYHINRPVTREEMMDRIWNSGGEGR